MRHVLSLPVILAVVTFDGAAGASASSLLAARAEVTLVPVAGTWKSTTESGQTVMTIDGAATAPPTTTVAEATVAQLFTPPDAFVRSLRAQGAFPLAIGREVRDFRRGEMRVQFKLVSGASDQTAGIAFNIRPDGSYLFARYNTKDGNVAIWVFKNGTRTVLKHGEAHQQLALGQWHELIVSVGDRSINAAAASGALQVTHTLDAPVTGRVGVWTKADSVTAFRRFDVTPE